MYVDSPQTEGQHTSDTKWPLKTVILLSIIATVVLGIYPDPVVRQISEIGTLLVQ